MSAPSKPVNVEKGKQGFQPTHKSAPAPSSLGTAAVGGTDAAYLDRQLDAASSAVHDRFNDVAEVSFAVVPDPQNAVPIGEGRYVPYAVEVTSVTLTDGTVTDEYPQMSELASSIKDGLSQPGLAEAHEHPHDTMTLAMREVSERHSEHWNTLNTAADNIDTAEGPDGLSAEFDIDMKTTLRTYDREATRDKFNDHLNDRLMERGLHPDEIEDIPDEEWNRVVDKLLDRAETDQLLIKDGKPRVERTI